MQHRQNHITLPATTIIIIIIITIIMMMMTTIIIIIIIFKITMIFSYIALHNRINGINAE